MNAQTLPTSSTTSIKVTDLGFACFELECSCGHWLGRVDSSALRDSAIEAHTRIRHTG